MLAQLDEADTDPIAELTVVVVDYEYLDAISQAAAAGDDTMRHILHSMFNSVGELDSTIDELLRPGPPRMAVIRQISIAEPWRGRRLEPLLIVALIRFLTSDIRMAVCRTADFLPHGDNEPTTSQADQFEALMTAVHSYPWDGLHLIDARNYDLDDPVIEILEEAHHKGWLDRWI